MVLVEVSNFDSFLLQSMYVCGWSLHTIMRKLCSVMNVCMHLSLRNTNQNIYTLAFWFLSFSLSLSLSNKVTYLNTEWLLVIIHTIYRMFNCVNSNRNHSMCALLWICDHLFDSSKMKFTYRGLKCCINDYLERFKLCKKWYRM